MSLFGKLLGSDSAINSVSNAIDKSILTDEERAELKVELWKAAHPFKIAQRFFMLLVVIPYMIVWGIAVGIYLNSGKTDLFNLLANDRVSDVFLAMAIFYFGGGAINTLSNFKKK